MEWNLEKTVSWYRSQGAPGDQSTLISLLREIQEEFGGIPAGLLPEVAALLRVKESFLLAVIRRQPRLRLENTHVQEICSGPNCGRRGQLAALAEACCAGRPDITLKFVPCMRQCGKGPNLKWDGAVHNRADEELLKKLLEQK